MKLDIASVVTLAAGIVYWYGWHRRVLAYLRLRRLQRRRVPVPERQR